MYKEGGLTAPVVFPQIAGNGKKGNAQKNQGNPEY
jgi:hypothetical protein